MNSPCRDKKNVRVNNNVQAIQEKYFNMTAGIFKYISNDLLAVKSSKTGLVSNSAAPPTVPTSFISRKAHF